MDSSKIWKNWKKKRFVGNYGPDSVGNEEKLENVRKLRMFSEF